MPSQRGGRRYYLEYRPTPLFRFPHEAVKLLRNLFYSLSGPNKLYFVREPIAGAPLRYGISKPALLFDTFVMYISNILKPFISQMPRYDPCIATLIHIYGYIFLQC